MSVPKRSIGGQGEALDGYQRNKAAGASPPPSKTLTGPGARFARRERLSALGREWTMTTDSFGPAVPRDPLGMRAPRQDRPRRDVHDTAPALRPGLEGRVAQQPARVLGHFQRPDIHEHQAEAVAAKTPVGEVAVLTYERGAPQRPQQRQDFRVLH